ARARTRPSSTSRKIRRSRPRSRKRSGPRSCRRSLPVPRQRTNKEPPDPKAQALKLLARREHSARELKRKLTARGIGEVDAAAAVADAAADGWQSDTRYAEMLVRSRISQGFGPMRIEAELRV